MLISESQFKSAEMKLGCNLPPSTRDWIKAASLGARQFQKDQKELEVSIFEIANAIQTHAKFLRIALSKASKSALVSRWLCEFSHMNEVNEGAPWMSADPHQFLAILAFQCGALEVGARNIQTVPRKGRGSRPDAGKAFLALSLARAISELRQQGQSISTAEFVRAVWTILPKAFPSQVALVRAIGCQIRRQATN